MTDEPAIYDALRAGIVNYSAAARSLDVDGDEESVATALRRFAEELEPREDADRRVSVRLRRGVALDSTAFGGVAIDDDGDATAIEVNGDVDSAALEAVLGRLRTTGIEALRAGVTDDTLVVAVPDRSGAEALRVVESALEAP